MSEKIFDLPEAVRLVTKVIEKMGEDFKHQTDPVREQCHNAEYDERCVNIFTKYEDNKVIPVAPGCLVGSAIHEAGHPLDWFTHSGVVGVGATDLLYQMTYTGGVYSKKTEMASEYMSAIQRRQDSGQTWGVSHLKGLQEVLRNVGEYDIFLSESEENWLDVR